MEDGEVELSMLGRGGVQRKGKIEWESIGEKVLDIVAKMKCRKATGITECRGD